MAEARAIFATVFRRLKPRTALPEVRVSFRPFANLNSSLRLADGRLEVRLSDLLEGAPASVLEALANILICKLYRQPVPAAAQARYRKFVNRKAVRRQLMLVRQARGRKQVDTPRGRHYNLEEIFQELNARYFLGFLAVPLLSWSRNRSRTMLGHFDPAHNTIIISRLFDGPQVPRYLLEYVMYHEMLHLKHPVEACLSGDRRRVHSRQFREEECRFAHYDAAQTALKQLLSN